MAIAGFVEATSGEVLINGDDQSRQPPYKRDTGLVFQHYALFPHLSVEKNVAFPLEMRGVGKSQISERVKRALDLVKLGSFGARKPSELSGGQQQRVALARALVYEPSILLLDEPLGALDKSLREEMQWEIRRIQQELAITTVAVTHDQHEAITMSDRIAIMRSGRIEQVGTPSEIYERPRSRYIAEFMGSSNFLRGKVEAGGDGGRLRVSSDVTVPLAPRTGSTFEGRMDLVIRPERMRCVPGDQISGGLVGAVSGVTYVGEAWQIAVKLDSGESLTASRANDGERIFSPGDRVAIDLGSQPWWAVPLEN